MDFSTKNIEKIKNRLAQERSPYLLQHAENPVEWFVICNIVTNVISDGSPFNSSF